MCLSWEVLCFPLQKKNHIESQRSMVLKDRLAEKPWLVVETCTQHEALP
jgi:hypothetical protein